MQKILFVITKGGWGGAQRYVFDLATNLSSSEHTVAVAMGEGKELGARLAEKGIRVLSLCELGRDLSPFRDFRTLLNLFWLFRRERPDVVHLNSSKAGGLGSLAARFCSLFSLLEPSAYRLTPKIIFTAHGLASGENRPILQKCAICIFEYLTILLSHRVICVSRRDAQKCRRLQLCRNKVAYIPLGIAPISFFSRDAAQRVLATALKKPAESLSEGPLIGTIAELTKNKGLEYALSALERLHGARYVIIGDGEERARLAEQIRAAKLESRVFLVGAMQDAARLLKAFDLFLIPSLKEGLPYVLLEAGAAEIPVIASAVGGVPDLIEDGETGLLAQPKDPAQIAEAVTSLIEDSRKRAALAAHLQTRVAPLTVARMQSATAALYRGERGAESERSF